MIVSEPFKRARGFVGKLPVTGELLRGSLLERSLRRMPSSRASMAGYGMSF